MPDPVANTVILDGNGMIVDVNEAWRAFGAANGLRTPQAGVGQNYLKFCVFAGPASSEILDDFTALLDGRRDLVSFLYDCHSPHEERWFTAVGFPQGPSRFVIAHVNVTHLIRHGRAFAAPTGDGRDGTNGGSATVADGGDLVSRLTPRQRQILMLLAQGKTNREIAAALATSPHTVRNQVSTILRLQIKNRVGAARLWASREA